MPGDIMVVLKQYANGDYLFYKAVIFSVQFLAVLRINEFLPVSGPDNFSPEDVFLTGRKGACRMEL
jgi:hypothetical protein